MLFGVYRWMHPLATGTLGFNLEIVLWMCIVGALSASRLNPPLKDVSSDKKFFGPPFPADYPEDTRPVADKGILSILSCHSSLMQFLVDTPCTIFNYLVICCPQSEHWPTQRLNADCTETCQNVSIAMRIKLIVLPW